ncbi:MAG: azurin [Pseudoxanthomonas sp.]
MIRKLTLVAILCAAAPLASAATCSVNLEGNDAMKFDLTNIDVPKSCTEFTLNLKHVGKLPKAAMGHNVVIARTADIPAVASDGLKAGIAADYVKAGDARVVAHSKLIGGGETTSVKIPVARLAGGPYGFFCSFPGHSALMKGTLTLK